MKRVFLYFKLFYYLYKLSKDPENTPVVLKITPTLIRLGFVEQSMKFVKPYEDQLNSSNYLLKPINLPELKKLPPGTLGAVYAEHMLSLGLDPNFYGQKVAAGDATQFLHRLRQTHDLWHVLTGFSTSVEDELGLQAFLYAQIRWPLSTILVGSALFKAALTNNPSTPILFDRIMLGWRTGTESKCLFALNWDANWATPIDDLRREFGLTPVSPSNLIRARVSPSASQFQT